MKQPSPKRDLVFEYVTIKAEGAILRERVRLADFNDGRPSVLSSAGAARANPIALPLSAAGFTDPVLEYP